MRRTRSYQQQWHYLCFFLFLVTLVSLLLSNGGAGQRVEGMWNKTHSHGFSMASRHSKIWLICPLVVNIIISTTFPPTGVEIENAHKGIKDSIWGARLTSHYWFCHHHVKRGKCLKVAHCSLTCIKVLTVLLKTHTCAYACAWEEWSAWESFSLNVASLRNETQWDEVRKFHGKSAKKWAIKGSAGYSKCKEQKTRCVIPGTLFSLSEHEFSHL